MQTQHTAAIHQLLTTPVRLDLGGTAQDIITIKQHVTELPQVVGDALKPAQDSITALATTMSTKVDGAATALKEAQLAAIQAARDELKQQNAQGFSKVMEALAKVQIPAPAPTPVPTPVPATAVVSDRNATLVRLLTQVLTLSVDANPGQPDKQNKTEWGENVVLEKLRKLAQAEASALPGDLQKQFLAAFERFSTALHDERYRRFTTVHALIPAITAHVA